MYEVRASVDSSLKKNTAFIKRLRTAITGSTLGAFLQDIRSLSLHKYLSEIISACYEGLCKLKSPSDVSAGVEIVSALHQRFGPAEFTGILAWFIGRGLAAPDKTHLRSLSVEVKEKEERERLSRQRNLLRVVTELWLVGALRSLNDVKPPDDAKPKSKDDTASAAGKAGEGGSKGKALANGGRVGEQRDTAPFPLEVLKEILGQDRDHANLPLVLTFLKTYAWDVLGVELQNAEERKIADEKPNPARAVVSEGEQPGVDDDDDVDNADGKASDAADGSMTSADLQQRFKNLFVQYFDGLKSHLTREQKALTAQARRNAEAYVRSGEVFEDRQSNYEKRVKAQEKLVADAQVLSQVLRLEMPDLREVDDRTTVTSTKVGLVNTDDYLRSQGEGAGIWEDEDERRFYENIVDLKERVPGILLEDGKKKTGADDQAAKKADASTESSGTDGKERLDPQTAAVEEGKRDGDAQEQLAAVASKSPARRLPPRHRLRAQGLPTGLRPPRRGRRVRHLDRRARRRGRRRAVARAGIARVHEHRRRAARRDRARPVRDRSRSRRARGAAAARARRRRRPDRALGARPRQPLRPAPRRARRRGRSRRARRRPRARARLPRLRRRRRAARHRPRHEPRHRRHSGARGARRRHGAGAAVRGPSGRGGLAVPHVRSVELPAPRLEGTDASPATEGGWITGQTIFANGGYTTRRADPPPPWRRSGST